MKSKFAFLFSLLLISAQALASITLAECSLCNNLPSYHIKAKQMFTGHEPVQTVYVFKTNPITVRKFLVSNPIGAGGYQYSMTNQGKQPEKPNHPGETSSYLPDLYVEEDSIPTAERQLLADLIQAYAQLKDDLLRPDTTVQLEPFFIPGYTQEISSVWDMVRIENERLNMTAQILDQMSTWQQFQARFHRWSQSIGATAGNGFVSVNANLEVPPNTWQAEFTFPDGSTVLIAFPPGGLPRIIKMTDSEGKTVKFPSEISSYTFLSFDVENQIDGWNNYQNWRDYLQFIGFNLAEPVAVGTDTEPDPANCVNISVEITCREEIIVDENGISHPQRICRTKFFYECP